MRSVTPFRGAQPPAPGSALCPYCEVVYQGGADSERCDLCGTPLVTLRPPGRRAAAAPLSDFGRGIVFGVARRAESRWGAPLWVTLAAIGLVLLLHAGAAALGDRIAIPQIRAALDGRADPLGLVLLTPLHLLGGLLVGALLRRWRLLFAALAGIAVALPPLDAISADPTILSPQIGPVLFWMLGGLIGGRLTSVERRPPSGGGRRGAHRRR